MNVRSLARMITLFAIVVPFLCVSPHAAAACNGARTESYIQLRMHQAKSNVLFEMPRRLVEDLARTPTGTTVEIGSYRGRPVRLSLDRMVRALRDRPFDEREVQILSRPTDLGAVEFFAREVSLEAAPREPNPKFLQVDVRPLGGQGSPSHLVLPILGADLLVSTLTQALGLQTGSDMTPFLEACVASAQRVGSGPLLKVTSPDAQIRIAAS
ncbi:MAG: hypothetical protein ACP5VF_00075 [Acidobacteriota bacterium]